MRAADVAAGARRVGIARALLLLPLGILAGRAAHLSVVEERGNDLGTDQLESTLVLSAERGAIFDRAGAELALAVEAPSIYAIRGEMRDASDATRKLARALGRDPRRVAAILGERSGFAFVDRWVEPERAERVRRLDLPGVGVLYEPHRVYPHKTLAGRALGFANIDGRGVRGIEQQEDAWLRGTARRLPVERDARGRLLAVTAADGRSTAGGDVTLTLDAALQADAEAALREAVRATRARGGVVVSLDPASGDLLALAELPEFDPNLFRETDYADTRSRVFLDAVDPGSTLKAFLVAAALERGAIRADQIFDCENGSYRVPGKWIHDSHPHGELQPPDILRVSSNIGAVKIAYALGPGEHFEMLRSFGFGRNTGSGFPDESAGVLRAWRSWRPVDHATIAFGQGIGVTPIQLAAATAVIANGGTWVRPRLVAARRVAGSAWQSTPVRVERRVLSRTTAAQVLSMLELAAGPEGTGRRAALRGVRVAGKTGTAQKFDPERGRYADDRFSAWFVGAVPADRPRLVIVAQLDEPERPVHTGGAAAAPLFARVAAAQLTRFGIFTEPDTGAPRAPETRRAAAPKRPAPVTRVAATAPAPGPVPELESFEDRLFLPDFRGLSVDEVRRITARAALAVEVSGSGRAVSQEPPPGTIVGARGATVHVTFASGEGEG